jgi:hypothetical protein
MQWKKNGLRALDEVICDYSRALLGAIQELFAKEVELNV